MLYSWLFSFYSAPIHWLGHGHMTSNNKTVSRAGNIAKTMSSNGKQFTVTREMLTAVARDQRWLSLESQRIFQNLLLFCFESQCLRFSGNKIHWSSRDQSLTVDYYSSITSFFHMRTREHTKYASKLRCTLACYIVSRGGRGRNQRLP